MNNIIEYFEKSNFCLCVEKKICLLNQTVLYSSNQSLSNAGKKFSIPFDIWYNDLTGGNNGRKQNKFKFNNSYFGNKIK